MSARIFVWNAVILPSRVAPIFTKATWSRPWWVESMPSERPSTHLIGRSSLREAHASAISSP